MPYRVSIGLCVLVLVTATVGPAAERTVTQETKTKELFAAGVKHKYAELNKKLDGHLDQIFDAVLIVRLPSGGVFYLDNALYGQSDDHIFFEIPP